jgi:hypothetical protein
VTGSALTPTAFGVEGVRLTRTGLTVTDSGLDYDAWENIGYQLGKLRDATAWALGDCLE